MYHADISQSIDPTNVYLLSVSKDKSLRSREVNSVSITWWRLCQVSLSLATFSRCCPHSHTTSNGRMVSSSLICKSTAFTRKSEYSYKLNPIEDLQQGSKWSPRRVLLVAAENACNHQTWWAAKQTSGLHWNVTLTVHDLDVLQSFNQVYLGLNIDVKSSFDVKTI